MTSTTPRAIVTDIEGTTSSIDFVKSVLFPYAQQHLSAFVLAHANDAQVSGWLDATAAEADVERGDLEALIHTLLGWIAEDRKATPLKALQGLIWADGYKSGAFRAHMYPEVADRLRQWHARDIRLHVYSSGSVPAQKLFFGYSEAGDLTALIDGWFDTRTGPKREQDSYRRIATAIDEDPADCLFLSDVTAELDAAAAAGMRTMLVCRPPQACPATAAHPCVTDFDAIIV